MAVRNEDADRTVASRLPRQIDLSDLRAVLLWSRHFGVTPAQLRRAVKQVGSDARELARYLGRPLVDDPAPDA